MNGLLLASQPQSKDIKPGSKNISHTKDDLSQTSADLFEELVENLLSDMPDEKDKNFLIAKLLDLPQDFDQKEKVLSSFSDEKLFTDNQPGLVFIEDLIKIAAFLKNTPDAPLDFPTDSKILKTSLLDLSVQKDFKNANNIHDLLKIAQKNGIKVKNFQFFKEDAALDSASKQIIRKVNSEDIFKMIEHKGADNPIVSKKIKSPKNILQNILSLPSKKDLPQQETLSLMAGEKNKVPQTKEKERVSKTIHTSQAQSHINPKNPKIVEAAVNTDKVLQNAKTVSLKIQDITHIQSHTKDNMPEKQAVSTLHTDPKNPKIVEAAVNTDKVFQNEKTVSSKIQNITHIQSHTKDNMPEEQSVSTLHTDPKNPKVIETAINTGKAFQADVKEKLSASKKIEHTIPKNSIESLSSDLVQKSLSSEAKESQNQHTHQFMKQTQEMTTDKKEVIGQKQTDFSRELEEKSNDTKESSPHTTTSVHDTKTVATHHVKHPVQDFKKTFHTFAQDFKEKVESYKSPLMKIKMQLNPGNLGDVDVTLINRGNQLQVNINSNPNTIAIFSQNQAEFKNSLVNMGFTGLQMNFGDNKDGQRGQNHKDNQKNDPFHEEDTQEQDGFEMIVPRYV